MALEPLKNMSLTHNTLAVYTGAGGEWIILLLYVAFVAASYMTTRSATLTSTFSFLVGGSLLSGDLFFGVNLFQTGSEPIVWAVTVLSLAATIYNLYGGKR